MGRERFGVEEEIALDERERGWRRREGVVEVLMVLFGDF